MILFFARTAKVEATKKPLKDKSWVESFTFWKHQLLANVDELKRSPYPVVWYDETLQEGNTFGEKLAFAMQQCFDLGYKKVIALGGDSSMPQLPWESISESISQENICIQEANDGGAMLVGMHKSTFSFSVFSKLPWRSKSFTESLQSSHTVCFLRVANWSVDFDTPKELTVAYLKALTHFKALRTYAAKVFYPSLEYDQGYPFYLFDKHKGGSIDFRGPPYLVA